MIKVNWKALALAQFISFTLLLVIYDLKTLGTISGASLIPAAIFMLVLLITEIKKEFKQEVKKK